MVDMVLSADSKQYQSVEDVSIFDAVMATGWLGIVLGIVLICAILVIAVWIIEESRSNCSDNPIIDWCSEIGWVLGIIACVIVVFVGAFAFPSSLWNLEEDVAKNNVMAKYSFDKVVVDGRLSRSEPINFDATVYSYERGITHDVEVWLNPITNEPNIKVSQKLTQSYWEDFLK